MIILNKESLTQMLKHIQTQWQKPSISFWFVCLVSFFPYFFENQMSPTFLPNKSDFNKVNTFIFPLLDL